MTCFGAEYLGAPLPLGQPRLAQDGRLRGIDRIPFVGDRQPGRLIDDFKIVGYGERLSTVEWLVKCWARKTTSNTGRQLRCNVRISCYLRNAVQGAGVNRGIGVDTDGKYLGKLK